MRKLAEWVSLVISAVILLGIIIYLLLNQQKPQSEFIEFSIRADIQNAKKMKNSYVLPIEITNLSQRAATQIHFEVETTGSGGANQKNKVEMEVDYLGGDSSETIYLYLEEKPPTGSIKFTPKHYRLD